MRLRVPKSPLPLLGKELVELAARRRTYWSRIVYAVLLFAVFCLLSYEHFRASDQPAAVLGHGRAMFETLVQIQFAGILLFLPALMSGVLTYEKERKSLSLLLLTDLRPGEILWQKYLSRLVSMLSFLLLALPLLAICYAFGGVSGGYLLTGIYALLLTCLQVGALALLCSSYCRTTLGAFILSYLLCVVFYLFVPLVLGFMLSIVGPPDDVVQAFVPYVLFVAAGRAQETFGTVVARSIPILFSIGLFLALARAYLIRRAFAPPRNALLGAFRLVDRFFAAVNRPLGNVQLVRDRSSLPTDQPIAWREVAKRSLGKARYLFRILVLIEVPILLIATGVLIEQIGGSSSGSLTTMLAIVWILAALALCVMSANVIVAERTSQTLDVLLTTPLTGREIVSQKLRGVRRLTLVFLIPFFSIFLIGAWWRFRLRWERVEEGQAWLYLLSSTLSVLVYLPLVSWTSLAVGLRARTRMRAILTALIVLVAWTVGPLLAFSLIERDLGASFGRLDIGMFYLLSPASMIAVTEAGQFELFFGDVPPLVPIAVNYLGYGLILFLIRTVCLEGADRALGRARPRVVAAPPQSGYPHSGADVAPAAPRA